jgi:surfeit locus 1 family protein
MRFRPSIGLSLVLLVLGLVFLRLGLWQLDRKAEKEALFERFESAPELGLGQALDQAEAFARVDAPGRLDPERHLLLDNRVWKGRAGVNVLTPLTLDDGRTLLVNRGWLPLPADRRSLPEFATDSSEQLLRGRLTPLPEEGLRLGEADVLEADDWPQLVTYFDLETAAGALGRPLLPWILQLDAEDPNGFEGRDWQPAVMGPETHGAYAVQWLGLLAAAVVIWILLGLRRGQSRGPE